MLYDIHSSHQVSSISLTGNMDDDDDDNNDLADDVTTADTGHDDTAGWHGDGVTMAPYPSHGAITQLVEACDRWLVAGYGHGLKIVQFPTDQKQD